MKIHLAGLRQMAALRNSFADVPPTVRFQISWFVYHPIRKLHTNDNRTDIRVACMGLTKPIFPFVRNARPSRLTIHPPNPDLAVIASRLFPLTEIPGLFSDTLSHIIYDLVELLWYAEWMKSYPSDAPSPSPSSTSTSNPNVPKSNTNSSIFDEETEEYFNTEVLYVEYSLHSNRYTPSGSPKSDDHTIEGCVRLACLLFHNTFIWDFYPAIAPVFPKPVTALAGGLSRAIRGGLFRQCPDLLIWVLFIGASSARILPERYFFTSELSHAVRARGIRSWQELRAALMPFFYVDRCSLGVVRELWAEIHTQDVSASSALSSSSASVGVGPRHSVSLPESASASASMPMPMPLPMPTSTISAPGYYSFM